MIWWWCDKHHFPVPATDKCPLCERDNINPSRRHPE
jgi:hypothetical protein